MATSLRTWFERGIAAVAVLYPVTLLATVLCLRYVGERWWLTGAILYLPRIAFAAPLPVIVLLAALARRPLLVALQVWSVLLLVFPVMGFVLPGFVGRAGGAPVIRILTFNINSAAGGEDKVVEQVERFSPDVVLFQELGLSGPSLAHRLEPKYSIVRVSTQFLIASRYPIVSTIEPGRIPLYGIMRSPRFIEQVIDTPLGKLAVYNVHPISPREGLSAIRGRGLRREILSGRLLAGINAPAMRANNTLRDLQLTAIAELAGREPYPVVIAGDTNLPGLSSLFRRHLSAYRDGFTEAAWGLGYTFPTNRRHAWMRLDRILASSALRFVHFEVADSQVSDHRSVVADLQLQPR